MKKIFWIIVFCCFFLSVIFCQPLESYSHGKDFTGYVYSIYSLANGDYLIKLDPERDIFLAGDDIIITDLTKQTNYFKILKTDANHKEMFSLAILAKTLNQRVWIRIRNTPSNDYNHINLIEVKP